MQELHNNNNNKQTKQCNKLTVKKVRSKFLHLLLVQKEKKNSIKLCLKLHKQYIADIEMVTGVTTNMSPNVLGTAVVSTQQQQHKEAPIKSDRRVSVEKDNQKKKKEPYKMEIDSS